MAINPKYILPLSAGNNMTHCSLEEMFLIAIGMKLRPCVRNIFF